MNIFTKTKPFACNFLLLTFLLLLFSFTAKAQESPVMADGAELKLISDKFSFTEGPAVDIYGNVFFTDQPNNRILKWSNSDSITVFMEDAGRSNGLYFDYDGNLLACADEDNQLWKITPEKEITVLIDDFKGKKLNGPNDLWVDSRGGFYFTDPYYQREYWSRTEKEIENERVYFFATDTKEIIPVAEDLVKPNGIIGSPDGKMLYVADIGDEKTWSYSINNDGSLSEKTLFAEMGSDGMTIDDEGNIYLTGDGVTVFNKSGEQIEHIPVPEDWTANVTFGGKGQQLLFITASKSLYTLEMKVNGVR
ncbi:MAG: SMP-30/gluconolactonase/LRE family protein [Balneolaceae bacterium]